jgi:steroid 5-alpha reductase family enzyme
VTFWTAALTGLVIIVAVSTLVWLLSVRLRDASIADIGWGPGFALLAWTYCAVLDAWTPRSMLLASLVTIWGARLGLHIFRRHRGEDPRYRAMRAARGDAFWWRSLFVVFWLQAVILWFVALPILAAAALPAPARVTAADVVGAALFAIGFAFEAIGDHQLARFRAAPDSRGRVLDTGLWRYTRHPNYFGDAVLWWGLYAIACAASGGWLTIASPALMTLLLLRVSGVTLLEQGLTATRPGYADYIARTSSFIPWRPRVRDEGP